MSSASAKKYCSHRNRIADDASRDIGPDLETILTRVKAGIEELKQEYLGEAHEELAELCASVHLAQNSVGTERSEAINRIFRISHDLRGVAGSFDYPLVTRIGSSICSIIENKDTISPVELAVIELHVGAVKVIMSNHMTGDRDPKALVLISQLDAMVSKCT